MPATPPSCRKTGAYIKVVEYNSNDHSTCRKLFFQAPVTSLNMSTYKLIYFNGKGRAELARFIFVQADVKYEDERITSGWMELKPKTPFGSLPVLVEDGKELGGSVAIARYLAEKFGLAGANAFENAEIASIYALWTLSLMSTRTK